MGFARAQYTRAGTALHGRAEMAVLERLAWVVICTVHVTIRPNAELCGHAQSEFFPRVPALKLEFAGVIVRSANST